MKTLHAFFIPLFVALFLLQGCALFDASPMPKMTDAETPSERITIAYGELQTLANTVNTIIASGVVLSQKTRNDIADTIDKLTMVVDMYVLNQVKNLSPATRLKITNGFTADVRIYAMAVEMYTGYENTADGQLRALMAVSMLTAQLLEQMEDK